MKSQAVRNVIGLISISPFFWRLFPLALLGLNGHLTVIWRLHRLVNTSKLWGQGFEPYMTAPFRSCGYVYPFTCTSMQSAPLFPLRLPIPPPHNFCQCHEVAGKLLRSCNFCNNRSAVVPVALQNLVHLFAANHGKQDCIHGFKCSIRFSSLICVIRRLAVTCVQFLSEIPVMFMQFFEILNQFLFCAFHSGIPF